MTQMPSDISSLAEQVAQELLKAIPGLRDMPAMRRSLAVLQAVNSVQGSVGKLRTAILDDLSFGDLRRGWVQVENAGRALFEDWVPLLLINAVIDGQSAAALIADARTFAGARTSAIEWYIALAGIKVTELVSLGTDMELVPWGDVPASYQKAQFSGASAGPEFGLPLMPFYPFSALPTCAIRIRQKARQVLFSSHEAAAEMSAASTSEALARNERIEDVVRCITVLSCNAVATLGRWMELGDKFARRIDVSGLWYGWALYEPAVRSASSNPIVLDRTPIAELVDRFERFRAGEKGVLRIALDRLNQALRRQSMIDKAIDGAVADCVGFG
jgi:hypothetical protein